MDGRTLVVGARQLEVVHHRIDNLQAAAMLSAGGRRIVGERKPAHPVPAGPAAVRKGAGVAAVGRRPAVPAAGIDNLDDTAPVPRTHLHLVLLAGSGML